MNKRYVVALFILLMQPGTTSAEDATTTASEPAYQLLYEQGFYQDAITLLDSLIDLDTAVNFERHYYLAASYIARGDRDSGAAVFAQMFEYDSLYQLDTLFTPPKILEVFQEVQKQRLTSSAPSSAVEQTEVPSPVSVQNDSTSFAVSDTGRLTVSYDSISTGVHPVLRISIGVLPGGIGAFYQKKPLRGALVLAAQVAAVAGSIWAYRTRQTYWSETYGWMPGENDAAYNRYTNYARVGYAVFIGSYTFSIIDYFTTIKKRRAAKYSHNHKKR
jgi:tetratricopeptide (TPR) repeat protein